MEKCISRIHFRRCEFIRVTVDGEIVVHAQSETPFRCYSDVGEYKDGRLTEGFSAENILSVVGVRP